MGEDACDSATVNWSTPLPVVNCPTGLLPTEIPLPATAWKSYVVDASTSRLASSTVVPNRVIDDIEVGVITVAGEPSCCQ